MWRWSACRTVAVQNPSHSVCAMCSTAYSSGSLTGSLEHAGAFVCWLQVANEFLCEGWHLCLGETRALFVVVVGLHLNPVTAHNGVCQQGLDCILEAWHVQSMDLRGFSLIRLGQNHKPCCRICSVAAVHFAVCCACVVCMWETAQAMDQADRGLSDALCYCQFPHSAAPSSGTH